jgi:hypothetical protein
MAGPRQLVEQRLCLLDGREKLARLAPPALLGAQSGEARSGAQFVPSCALLAGDRQGGAK